MFAHRKLHTCFSGRLRVGMSVVVTAALAVWTTGCLKGILTLGYLIGGPPSVEPDFEKETKKSLTDYDVTVAVVCYAPTELKLIDEKVDKNVAKHVSYKLNAHRVKVVNPDRIQEWLDTHDDWETPDEIGAAFQTTYVIYIDLRDYSLYEKGNQSLFRGRAESFISVWEMDGDEGERIYSRELKTVYPLAIPKSTHDVSYEKFRKLFLDRLTKEIGWLFYEHYNGEDMVDAT